MKLSTITLLHLAIAASAAVLGSDHDFQGLKPQKETGGAPSWWSSLREGASAVAADIDDFFGTAEEELLDELDSLAFGEHDDADRFFGGHSPHHGRDFSNLTIYQIISESNYTKTFAKFVDKHDNIVDILNSTDANYTLFVPIDHGRKGKDHDKSDDKPSDEFVEHALQYHIADGEYPARRLWRTHTLPTLLKEPFLGGEAQRLRIGFSILSGIRVNFFSKVVAANFVSLPPPPQHAVTWKVTATKTPGTTDRQERHHSRRRPPAPAAAHGRP
jgi:hypothetical protein